MTINPAAADIDTPQVMPEALPDVGPDKSGDVIVKERPRERLDDGGEGDHDRFAHYVFGRNPKAKVTQSMVTGTPIRALCGKKWVPSRDGSRYPVCPDCKAIKDKMLGGSSGGDGE